jgi:hypothetical protein
LILFLEDRTTVFLKKEGLLSKLEPRYTGPYKIVGHTKFGNYELEDSDGLKLDMFYPLHKLKVVKNPEDLTNES